MQWNDAVAFSVEPSVALLIPDEELPSSFKFTQEDFTKIDEIIRLHPFPETFSPAVKKNVMGNEENVCGKKSSKVKKFKPTGNL
jgi:hypothetical protein